MLNDKQIQKLAGLAKVSVDDLKSGISSEEEATFEISDDIKSFNTDELTMYTNNSINEAKQGIQTAALEKASKEHARSLGLELSGDEMRDFGKVTEAYKAKLQKELGNPSDTVEKYKKQLGEKDGLLNELKTKLETKENEFNTFKTDTEINANVMGSLSAESSLPVEDRLLLFKSKYKIAKNENGAFEVADAKTGNVILDDFKNPKALNDIVSEFDKKYISINGRGGNGNGNQSSGDNTNDGTDRDKKMDAIYKQAAQNHKEGSKEYYDEVFKLSQEQKLM